MAPAHPWGMGRGQKPTPHTSVLGNSKQRIRSDSPHRLSIINQSISPPHPTIISPLPHILLPSSTPLCSSSPTPLHPPIRFLSAYRSLTFLSSLHLLTFPSSLFPLRDFGPSVPNVYEISAGRWAWTSSAGQPGVLQSELAVGGTYYVTLIADFCWCALRLSVGEVKRRRLAAVRGRWMFCGAPDV